MVTSKRDTPLDMKATFFIGLLHPRISIAYHYMVEGVTETTIRKNTRLFRRLAEGQANQTTASGALLHFSVMGGAEQEIDMLLPVIIGMVREQHFYFEFEEPKPNKIMSRLSVIRNAGTDAEKARRYFQRQPEVVRAMMTSPREVQKIRSDLKALWSGPAAAQAEAPTKSGMVTH